MKINMKPVHGFVYNQLANYDFCFALLTKDYQILHSPFMCKDYLQDIFWSQHTGKDANIYGIKTTVNMLPKRIWYELALIWTNNNLREKIDSIKNFLHPFEDAQEIKRSKILETEDDDKIVVKFHKDWAANGPLLSTFSTIIRLSGGYQDENPLEYLKKLRKKRLEGYQSIKPPYMIPDVQRLNIILPKLAAVLAGKEIKHSWKELETANAAHYTGLYGWREFPTVEVN
jgi:hypothetical protein